MNLLTGSLLVLGGFVLGLGTAFGLYVWLRDRDHDDEPSDS